MFSNAKKEGIEVFEMREIEMRFERERREKRELEMRFEREEARGSCIKNIRRVTFVVHKNYFLWNLMFFLNILEIYIMCNLFFTSQQHKHTNTTHQ